MFKKLGLSIAALVTTAAIAIAAGAFQGFPLLGDTAGTTCLSYGNNSVCNQYRPAGPAALTGKEQIPADTGSSNQPATILIPTNLLANGYGDAAVLTTTGTTATVTVSDGVSNQIYAGAGTATYTSFKLPANPIDNQKVCLTNAGSGILTLTAVAASANTYGNTPTITGVTPTSIPVATAVGTAGIVTLSSNCWIYVAGASNTGVWYRIL
mgnify:CR=1 FL=1|jgi:hypothetical protein